MTHWRSGLRKHGFHHDEQCDENVAIIDSLVAALNRIVHEDIDLVKSIQIAKDALASVER